VVRWLSGRRSEDEGSRRREFEKLARDHYKDLFRAAYRLTGDRDEAADLTQEALVKAYVAFHQFQRDTNFRAWMLRIMANTHVSRYRQRERRPKTESWDATTDAMGREKFVLADPNGSPEELVLAAFHDEEIERALIELPEDFRTVLIMADLYQMPYKDVADALGVPIGTVRSRLFRARRLMRRALADYARSRGLLGGDRDE